MSAFNFRQALGLEKPHSSTTDWIDILTGNSIEEEAYDGIPELVETINLQASGPAEASRAIRKKLKHGNSHQQYRALVLLKALVENCGTKFQTSFADGQLTDALKQLAGDASTDKRVKKKLLLVLASWKEQFKGDPSMSLVSGLYDSCKRASKGPSRAELAQLTGDYEEKRKAEKEEARRKARQEKEEAKERARREEEERRRRTNRPRRAPFDFEKEKPKVLNSIVEASQASSNLVNAIRLVNPENDSLERNTRVQECLETAKQARKVVVRYIQLVENEELIGTLIETNERVMSAIEMYDHILTHGHGESTDEIAKKLSETQISAPTGDILRSANNSQQSSQSPVHDSNIYSDLQDLNFGSIGGSANDLPAPIRPSSTSRSQEQASYENRGSLSDFSDYESSDEETHNAAVAKQGTARRDYVSVSDDEDTDSFNNKGPRAPLAQAEDKDPFADPFADEVAVGPSKRW